MITGAHAVIFSRDAEADRAFLRDVIGLSSVDAGGGWLIFALPPSEVAVHPSESNGAQSLFLMCEDINAFVAQMAEKKVECSGIREEPWGRLSAIRLPGGGELSVYQPLHERPNRP